MNRTHILLSVMLLTFWCLFIGVLFASGPAKSLQTRGTGQISGSACTLKASGPLDGGGERPTFERTVAGAKFIVEANVQSVNPALPPKGFEHWRDVILIPVRVLKGSNTFAQFEVLQFLPTYFEMQPGQHFLLFLGDPDPRLAPVYPAKPGVPQFGAGLGGILCIDSGTIRVSPAGNYMRSELDGVGLDNAISDIKYRLSLQH
jgi:hypothetical protein